MARENLMSLKAVPLQFAEFKPTTFTPAESNLEILNRSMEKIDAREKESIQAKDVMSTTLNEIRSKLNPEEFAKFDEKAQQARDEINTQIELGRYGLAMSTAYNFGRSFADDTEWQNKMRTQQERETKLAEMRQVIKDKATSDMYEELNPYEYDGTGTYTFKNNDFVEHKSTYDILTAIAEGTPPQAGSNTTERTSTSPITKSYEGLTFSVGSRSSSSSSSSSYEKRTVSDMLQLFNAALDADPKLRQQLYQNYQVAQYQYKKAIDKINSIANITGNTPVTQDALNVLKDFTSSREQRDEAIAILTNNGVLSNTSEFDSTSNIKGGLTIDELNNALEDYRSAISAMSNKDGIAIFDNFDKWKDSKALEFFEAKDYVRINTKSSSNVGSTYDDSLSKIRKGDADKKDENKALAELLNVGTENGGVQTVSINGQQTVLLTPEQLNAIINHNK